MDEKMLKRCYEAARIDVFLLVQTDVIATSATASVGPTWGNDVSDGGWTD